MNTIKSAFLALNKSDFAKGIILSILSAIASYVYQTLQAHSFTAINLHQIATTAILAALAYLTKNLLTNSQDKPFSPEPKPENPQAGA